MLNLPWPRTGWLAEGALGLLQVPRLQGLQALCDGREARVPAPKRGATPRAVGFPSGSSVPLRLLCSLPGASFGLCSAHSGPPRTGRRGSPCF